MAELTDEEIIDQLRYSDTKFGGRTFQEADRDHAFPRFWRSAYCEARREILRLKGRVPASGSDRQAAERRLKWLRGLVDDPAKLHFAVCSGYDLQFLLDEIERRKIPVSWLIDAPQVAEALEAVATLNDAIDDRDRQIERQQAQITRLQTRLKLLARDAAQRRAQRRVTL